MNAHRIRIRTLLWTLMLVGLAGAARAAEPATCPSCEVEKTWLTDFPTFANANATRQWIVGRTTTVCLNEGEAMERARHNTRQLLVDFLRPQLSAPGRFGPDDEAWLKQRLTRELATGRLVKDRWVSHVKRPYGEVWSAALLVDASSDRLATIAREHDIWRLNRDTTVRRTGASIVGLSVVILLVYAVLNVLTKGYFRGRLRAMAGFAMCGGAAVLIWLMRAAG
jgi:hypothetical protein